MSCKCKKTNKYLITKEIATAYANRTGKTVAIFYCSDWDFCEFENANTLKTKPYEYIVPSENS